MKKINYQDYASGSVLYGLSGAPNFSVRLMDKIFKICTNYFKNNNIERRLTVYDPFCGIGYALTVLGFLYHSHIQKLIGSDINETMLQIAGKNLSLLSVDGIDKRINEIKKHIVDFDKESHKQALESALNLRGVLETDIEHSLFQHDIYNVMKATNISSHIDIIFSDLPYGGLTQWTGNNSGGNSTQNFLNNIQGLLHKSSLVVIVCNKKQSIEHLGYRKIKTLKIGLRKVIFLGVE